MNQQLTEIVHEQYTKSGRKNSFVTPERFREALDKIPNSSLSQGNINNYARNSDVLGVYRFNNGLNGSSAIYNYSPLRGHEIIILIGSDQQRAKLRKKFKKQGIKLKIKK